MELKFTQHPIVKPPTDEEILFLAQNEPKILAELHAAHEGRIRGVEEDPLRHGFDLDGWQRMGKQRAVPRWLCKPLLRTQTGT